MNPLLNNPFAKFNGNNNSNNPNQNNNFPQVNPQMRQFMSLMQGKNPMDVLNQYAQNNPQMQPVINMLKNGTNPEQLVRSICKERGINVDEFMKQFR